MTYYLYKTDLAVAEYQSELFVFTQWGSRAECMALSSQCQCQWQNRVAYNLLSYSLFCLCSAGAVDALFLYTLPTSVLLFSEST